MSLPFLNLVWPYLFDDPSNHDSYDSELASALKLTHSSVPNEDAFIWTYLKLSHADFIDLPLRFDPPQLTGKYYGIKEWSQRRTIPRGDLHYVGVPDQTDFLASTSQNAQHI